MDKNTISLFVDVARNDNPFLECCPAGGLDLEKSCCLLYLLASSKCENIFMWTDSSVRSMLELLVSKKHEEHTSRRVKCTSGPRDLTISFQPLPGPMSLKLLDFNMIFVAISFRKTSEPMFLKQDRTNCF